MLTLNTIYREMKEIPVSRLEELYQFVHALAPKTKPKDSLKKKIMSFGGAFKDMSARDYSDFISETNKTRTKLFDRNIEI